MTAEVSFKRLINESMRIEQAIKEDPNINIKAGIMSDDNPYKWWAIIKGPDGSIYEGMEHRLHLTIPDTYPFHGPKVVFESPIFHPNVDENGELDLMSLIDTSKGDNWCVSIDIKSTLLIISSVLGDMSSEYYYNIYNEMLDNEMLDNERLKSDDKIIERRKIFSEI